MKQKNRILTRLAALVTAATLPVLSAAPLTNDASVHATPDAASAVIATLNAGVEPVPTSSPNAIALPANWQAVDIVTTNDLWVRDSDLNKELEVKPGSAFRADPREEAPVLGTMAAGDASDLLGLKGKWVQLRITKKTTGYINLNTPPAKPTSTPPASSQVAQVPPAAPAAQPAPLAATSVPDTGRAVEQGDGGSASLPRSFQGVFASTRRAFTPRRPYDYQLTDSSGSRFAYLDISKLLTSEQFDNYIGRTVIIYGTAIAVPNSKEIVIKAETLQMR